MSYIKYVFMISKRFVNLEEEQMSVTLCKWIMTAFFTCCKLSTSSLISANHQEERVLSIRLARPLMESCRSNKAQGCQVPVTKTSPVAH